MPTLYKLHKKGNYIGRIIAIGQPDAYANESDKRLSKKKLLGAIGEVDKLSHVGNGMIECFFYPLRQAKANKDREIFHTDPCYFIKVKVQKIKEKI